MTSVVLSAETREKIEKFRYKRLTPLCQVPFGLGGYHVVLEDEFGYREESAGRLDFEGVDHPLFAVRPNIYAHKEGAINVDLSDIF